jgi:hypothetical protein
LIESRLAEPRPTIEFRTSSFCTGGGCVEIGHTPDGSTLVRDSKDPHRVTELVLAPAAWAAFLDGVRHGDFGSPGS